MITRHPKYGVTTKKICISLNPINAEWVDKKGNVSDFINKLIEERRLSEQAGTCEKQV